MKSPKDILDAAIADRFANVPKEHRTDFMKGLGETYALVLEVLETAQNEAYEEGRINSIPTCQ